MEFTTAQWIWLAIAAFSIGITKMGLSGVVTVMIPIAAMLFGGKESTGYMLPLLIAGDIFAVIYYKHHIQVGEIKQMLVWLCAGILIGALVGQYISDETFKMILSISVILCIVIMVYAEIKGKQFTVPNKMIFFALVGILGGFTSIIGNAAGAIISIYLLSRGYPKESYISTYAWLFLIINLIKLPLQIFLWNNIGITHLYTTLILLPVILAGAAAGVFIVKRINDKLFRKVIYTLTLISAVVVWL